MMVRRKNEQEAIMTEQRKKRLSLDFANTVSWRGSDHPEDSLSNFSDLVKWSREKGVISDNRVKRLFELTKEKPQESQSVFLRAIAVREAIYRIYLAASKGNPPDNDDIKTFNIEISRALSRSQIIPMSGTFTWDLIGEEEELDSMLWPVVHDAANLLTSDLLARVGACADEDCEWLFIDTSRNRSRRWCAMGDCGNRAKARRFYERKRSAE
jgi:predicted RNA-binding Zn ribbon-like protein